MRRSTKRLAAAILIAALGILSACGTDGLSHWQLFTDER